jgi:hypothetical protein
MPVESLECPNCGAPLEQVNELTRCTFCHSTLQVKLTAAGRQVSLEGPPPAAQLPEAGLPAGKPQGATPVSVEEATAMATHIQALLQQRRRIDALRLYRERTNAGLAECMRAIEQLETDLAAADLIEKLRAGWQPGQAKHSPAIRFVSKLAQEGKTGEAALLYQGLTGMSQAESRDALAALSAEVEPDELWAHLPAALIRDLILRGKQKDAARLYQKVLALTPDQAREDIEAIAGGLDLPFLARFRAKMEDD